MKKSETPDTPINKEKQSLKQSFCLGLNACNFTEYQTYLDFWEIKKAELDTCTPMVTAALFTIARRWQQSEYLLTEEKIKMGCIYNGILFNYKKELNNAICSNMDGTRDCHTEWSNSDWEGQISWYHLYMESKKMVQINVFTKQK